MDISSVNSDLIRGNVTTIILGCLVNEDKYGYEILKQIEDKSTGQYTLKQATLYNQLKRLEKQGLISSYDGSPDETGGGQRRYYTLTFEGRNYLLKERTEYEYSRTILDKLVSSKEFDFTSPLPFEASELRPYTKRDPSEEKPKVVYKDKIVEVEKVVEQKVYVDMYGNPISEEDAEALKAKEAEEKSKLAEQEAEISALQDKLKLLEAQRLVEQNESSKLSDEQLKQKDEEIESIKKQLSDTEIERDAISKRLADILAEQALKAKEDEDRQKEIEELERQKLQLKEDQQRFEEEQQRLKDEQLSEQTAAQETEFRRQTLAEVFARLDAKHDAEEAERRKQEEARLEAERQAQMEAEAKAEQERLERERLEQERLEQERIEAEKRNAAPSNRSSMDEIFRRIEQQKDEELARNKDEAAADSEPIDYLPSEIIDNDEKFEYENSDVDYRGFLYNITDPKVDEAPKDVYDGGAKSDGDIKTRLYSKGFKIRPYDKGNTSEYYTFNFLHSNRINRDTFLIVLGIYVLEVAIMWLSLTNRISYKYFLPVLLGGMAICLIPTVIYFINPTKRIRANFNFKLSVLNRCMLYIELTVVCILIGFFALGASVNDIDLILGSIVIPAVLLLNIPISSAIYWLLYRTRKYHTA